MVFFGLMGLLSCSNVQKTTTSRSLADTYNPSRANIHPTFNIFHVNEDNSIIYVRIFPNELLFNQTDESGENTASLSLYYAVRDYNKTGETGAAIDSAMIHKTLNKKDARSSYFTAVPVTSQAGKKYSVEIFLRDDKRGSFSRNFLLVDKSSEFNAQNFRVLSPLTGYPTFSNNFSSLEYFRLYYNKSTYDSLYVDYYKPERSLPMSVFATTSEVSSNVYPDSAFVLPFSDTLVYNLPEQGMYHFRVSLDHTEGLTLFNFGKNFPLAKTSEEMLPPLVYLSSPQEFRELESAVNRKLAIDNFWLRNSSSNTDDARELIRVYYNRVLFSNLWFSGSKEGWKTDRGMIYIIFGAPDKIERSIDTEKWIYFDRKKSARLEFIFDRQDNFFSDTEFKLRRSLSSTSIWAEAVRSWRNGKIYSPAYK